MTLRFKKSSRRSFLAYFLGFFALGCSKEKFAESSKPIVLGKLEDFVGKTTVLSLYRITIFSDDLGLRAVKMVCTHQFCGLNRSSNGFSCPCHGSKFSNSGEVVRGPARRALSHLKLSVSAGGNNLKIWPRQQVEASWRLVI